jgi:dTMP kinase
MAYQGFGQGAERGQIAALSGMLGLTPDLTLVLDVPVDVSLRRLASRASGADRYERLGAPFFTRIREGFLAVAASAPERCVMIDADASEDTVAGRILDAVDARLPA